MNWVEIACPPDGRPLSAPFLRKPGEVDPRSYGNIAQSLDLSDCTTPHGKVRKAFDFMIRSTDYFTFQGAEFRKGENVPYTAESASLLAINSYACFECGPLNTIASGIFINSLGCPAVLTFGNGHLFQQVWLNGKPRVFDLSAQQYFPSRDMDDAASLEELETDIYLLAGQGSRLIRQVISTGWETAECIRRCRFRRNVLPIPCTPARASGIIWRATARATTSMFPAGGTRRCSSARRLGPMCGKKPERTAGSGGSSSVLCRTRRPDFSAIPGGWMPQTEHSGWSTTGVLLPDRLPVYDHPRDLPERRPRSGI